MDTRDLELVANDLRHDVVRMLAQSKSGHPGGSLSAADIMAVLFFSGVRDFNPDDPNDHGADRFFLSKGHAAPVLYAVWHRLGWLGDDDLMTLRRLGSRLQGHPDSNFCPGVEVCSGSLGQGLSVASGCALGLKLDAAATGEEPHQVFALLGDGEMQEGSNWEALMFAAHNGLDNLCAIVDLNNLQIDGHVTDVCSLGDIDAKLTAFGWNVTHVNGHDVEAVYDALVAAKAAHGAPQAVVCDTVKGKGVSFMEDQASWHGTAPNAEQAAQALAELDAARATIEKEA